MGQLRRPVYRDSAGELHRMSPDDWAPNGAGDPSSGETNLDIVNNEVTITKGWHRLRATGTAAERQLHRILGGVTSQSLIIQSTPDSDDFQVKDEEADGNLILAGNYGLGNNPKRLMHLLYDGTNWYEVSRSTN